MSTPVPYPLPPEPVRLSTRLGVAEVRVLSERELLLEEGGADFQVEGEGWRVQLKLHFTPSGSWTSLYTAAECNGDENEARNASARALSVLRVKQDQARGPSAPQSVRRRVRTALEEAGRTWAMSDAAVPVFYQAAQARQAACYAALCRDVLAAEAQLQRAIDERDAQAGRLRLLDVSMGNPTTARHVYQGRGASESGCRWCHEARESGLHLTAEELAQVAS